ncbi:c-type cytochrome [Halodurantibacterium flavum]|uniref:C-type cytochrome n=1 Tax=Halodurantibacterium flavum TaxID=1382802 RepID=A0ABW4S782_9RHOB
MKRLNFLLFGTAIAATLALGGLASAQSQQEAVATRQAQFKLFQEQLATLGNMARGTTPYDAATASAAAAALSEAAARDQDGLWPEGTDSASISGTRALPVIWDNYEDFLSRFETLRTAATQMETAAGTDLASLQGAMGGLSGACGACHRDYRAPE